MIDYIGSLSSLGYSGDTSEGGEEPAPWWDDTALVDIDFLNDRAWTVDDGEVAISTLLGTDATEVAWTPTEYSSDNLNEDGYQSPSNKSAAFLGAAKTALLSGSTVIFEFKDLAAPDPAPSSSELLFLTTSDASNALEFVWEEDASGLRSISWAGALNENGGVSVSAGINRAAMTITPTRVETALNGALVTEAVTGEDDWPSGEPTLSLAITQIISGVRLRRLKIKDPLPDATNLAALSAL